MSWVNSACRRLHVFAIGAWLLENVNALAFAGGLLLVVSGVRMWSPAAANVTAGVIVMLVAALPYVVRQVIGKRRG